MPKELFHINPLEITITTEVYGYNIDLKMIMKLCEIIDAFEVVNELEDVIMVDVKRATPEHIIMRLTPMRPISYANTLDYIETLIQQMKDEMGSSSIIVAERIEWLLKETPNMNVVVDGTKSTTEKGGAARDAALDSKHKGERKDVEDLVLDV